MKKAHTSLLSGDEAVAQAALDTSVALGTGYPGTPSTEILEHFSSIGGRAQWAPNEKVALEVGLGAAFAGAKAIVTMKHVGLNVAADPLFTSTHTDLAGALVLVSADDPGMASSQNEQDNRRYAVAAGIPMFEPADSQEAYDYTKLALEVSAKWQIPVMLRMTTRVCHSQTVVNFSGPTATPTPKPFQRDIQGRVMIPAYAKPAHRRLRQKLTEIAKWNANEGPTILAEGDNKLGIVTSGISYQHSREAAPSASVLKIGMTHPLPIEKIRAFADKVDRCMVIEEGDPYLTDSLLAAGMKVEGKNEMYRFGELNVTRVERILSGNVTPEPEEPKGKPPALCNGCPHRITFTAFRDLDCIVAGDIGCYTLGVLPPFQAIDTCVCMGGSITVGLGMRHTLPEADAKRVVSVIGDSTFMHTGINGIVEMVYNRPKTGHVVVILDNATTAMTGMQEHPGTGRTLDHQRAGKVDYEALLKAIGVDNVHTLDPIKDTDDFVATLKGALGKTELTVIIARRPCLLAAGKIKQYEAAISERPTEQNNCGGKCQ